MLDCGSGVGGEANVSHHTQHKGIACVAHSGSRCKVELLTHAILWVADLVVVQSAGGQTLEGDMVKDGG